MREEVQKLNYSVAFKESAIVALREKAKEDLKKTVETLNEKHKVAMDKMNRENLEEARKMLQDFEMGQNFLKNQIAVQTQQ